MEASRGPFHLEFGTATNVGLPNRVIYTCAMHDCEPHPIELPCFLMNSSD